MDLFSLAHSLHAYRMVYEQAMDFSAGRTATAARAGRAYSVIMAGATAGARP
jgi:hypothetical protein